MKNKHYYIQLPKDFCLKNKEYKEGASEFGFSQGNDGIYYASVNTLNEFPELFDGVEIVIVSKEKNEFPISEKRKYT